MKKDQELIVITKTYDLILWSCHHTSRFPRNHRFVLGERIERNLYGLLETLIRAKYTRNRQTLLEEANLSLEILRFQMRLAKDLQCLKSWIGHARHANTYRLRTDLFRTMTFQRAAAKPSSPSGRGVQQSTGERPLGEP